ncbi:phage holin family protein [Lysobacter sp. D1-1-M9]|uniref:phage holin family protein n=1 Tax=Novilysobacter longmucuonensis TaxID=3098603 RepID=UPI002FC740F9
MNAQPDMNRPQDPQAGARAQAGNGHAQTGNGHGQTSAGDPSFGVLLRELAHEVPALLTKEAALAKSEMRENLRATKEGVAAVSTGGAVVLGGFIVLLMAAVYALSNVMAPWLAALLVGAAVTVVGMIMVSAGRKKFQAESLRPDHTMSSLHKDRDAVRGRTQ